MVLTDHHRSTALEMGEATKLAHGLGALVAAEIGARALTIKGPAADHHRLRAARISADADLWVDPARYDDFRAALERRGWHVRVARVTPEILDSHSTTYIHDRWPCDIDVHRTFPGFFAEPLMLFEELWRRRQLLAVGSIEVTIPSLVASAVIGALHAQRNMTIPRHQDEWIRILDALQHRFTPEQQVDFADLAEVGRARWVLREPLELIGSGPVAMDLTPAEARIWQTHVDFGADGGGVAWLLSLREGTLVHRVSTAWRAIWVPRSEIPRNDVTAVPNVREVWRYQRERWARGAQAVFKYVQRRGR